MKEMWTRFMKDESGQGLVEYVLIIAVVALGVILALGFFRTRIGESFKRAGQTLDAQPQQTYTT